MHDPADATRLVDALAQALSERNYALATAESCTGGWIAKLLTDKPGSSAWFERGLVTYSNDAKQELLAVSANTLERYGAVSAETVAEMAQGALRHSHAQVSVAVSGIAGPDGGSTEKPVGTVWLAWAMVPNVVTTRHHVFTGDRDSVRQQAVQAALQGVLQLLSSDHATQPR